MALVVINMSKVASAGPSPLAEQLRWESQIVQMAIKHQVNRGERGCRASRLNANQSVAMTNNLLPVRR